MARLDASNAVDLLIRAAAPERAPKLPHTWGDQQNRVHLTDDSRFDIGAWFGMIQVTEHALRQLWLLGFASWRAIQAYSGVIWLLDQTHRPFNRDEIAGTHGQAAADAAFDALIAKAKAFREATESDAIAWPDGVPEPTEKNDLADLQQKVAFDLLCISGAYIFLHEIQHVRFARDERTKPSDPVEEEHACDRFAREFLMGGIDAYVVKTGEPIELVRAKRALGIAVAKVLIMEVTPADRWGATDTHPSVSERVRLFLESLQEPLTENFWISVASFLAAICRSRGRLPDQIPFLSPRELALRLAQSL
jgi:hypothetical protein